MREPAVEQGGHLLALGQQVEGGSDLLQGRHRLAPLRAVHVEHRLLHAGEGDDPRRVGELACLVEEGQGPAPVVQGERGPGEGDEHAGPRHRALVLGQPGAAPQRQAQGPLRVPEPLDGVEVAGPGEQLPDLLVRDLDGVP
ncbi:hypothetical protein GCM10025782_06190 [Pedococcus ginsenosidimutans]|uniref:Uncharacterized protein n=1 Tax=Pedococcus ginsenosidimutans TaxID=490570 RepID=A0ABP8XQ97_9MICO